MLKITFFPDGVTSSALVLCNTSRAITELNVEFNHTRVLSVEHLATALGSGAAGFAQDFGNQRNILSLRVRRGVDFAATPAAFADPEGALAFALQQPAQFPGTGSLKIELQGRVTSATLWLLNTGVQSIRNKFEDLGIAPAFDYVFNGGLITPIAPF